MSTLYRRGRIFYVGVPTRSGGWRKRSTGTTVKAKALPMSAMLDEMGPRGTRAWEFLDALEDGRLTVAALHDAWSTGPHALDALRASLKDADTQEAIPGWIAWLRDRVAPDTIQHYTTQVRSFIPAGERFPVSRINRTEIARWLAALPGRPGTKRKYRAALSSFASYLVEMGLIPVNPVLQVKPPKAGAPRMRYLSHAEVVALVEAQPEPFRTISALMHATGMEISAVLRATRADLDTNTWMIRAHGTKTSSRDRQAYVKAWARPYLLAHIADLLPGAPLFPNITRWAPAVAHAKACAEIWLAIYTLRDSRYIFAVESAKAGIPAHYIANQLGYADTQMVNKVYMRFQPSVAEMARVFERAEQFAAGREG